MRAGLVTPPVSYPRDRERATDLCARRVRHAHDRRRPTTASRCAQSRPAATGFLAFATLALWLRHDYRQEKLATLEPPFRSGLVGIEGAGTPARLVFFGDSRIAQWDLAGFERFGPVLNAGFGGDTLAGMADRLDRDVLAARRRSSSSSAASTT